MGDTSARFARERIKRLREELTAQGMDAFYVRDTSNIAWLSAFEGVFDGESAHAAYVDSRESRLHTDSRYSSAFRVAAAGGPWDVDDDAMPHAKWLRSLLAAGFDVGELLVEDGGKDQKSPEALQRSDERFGQTRRPGSDGKRLPIVGIEQSMALGEFRRLEKALIEDEDKRDFAPEIARLRETSGLIVNLRAVKDAYELKCLRAAQAVTDAAFAHMRGFIRPGMSERQVQLELEDFMLRHGGSGLAFSSIVATGANGANPHAIPGDARLEAGQCVVMDFGARARGYCSDMTRMVFLGEPDERMRQAYATLREANEQVEAMLRPGVTGAQAHQLAEDILAAGGFGGKMGHSLGHGVGIDIHEEPVLALRNESPLAAGNVVTVEPGIYLEGDFGMRLEDCGVITNEGFDVFTRSTHEMVVI